MKSVELQEQSPTTLFLNYSYSIHPTIKFSRNSTPENPRILFLAAHLNHWVKQNSPGFILILKLTWAGIPAIMNASRQKKKNIIDSLALNIKCICKREKKRKQVNLNEPIEPKSSFSTEAKILVPHNLLASTLTIESLLNKREDDTYTALHVPLVVDFPPASPIILQFRRATPW